MIGLRHVLTLGLLTLPAVGMGQTAEERFVESNLLATFYHEMGHALIEILGLPVFGQEEDAADVASVLFTERVFDADTALEIADQTALGFLLYADRDGEPVWWDTHGPDLQRHFTLICLAYGADPEARADLAADFDLPDERAETCSEEYDLAEDSWGPVLDEITNAPVTLPALMFTSQNQGLTARLIGGEVAELNKYLSLPEPLSIRVAPCGEANGFFDPQDLSITVCEELETELWELIGGDQGQD